MRFALTAEQRQFATTLDDLLTAAAVPSAVRAWASGDHAPGLAIWRELADLGVMALAVPERFGGLDADKVDLVVAFEQLGRHVVPGPLVESIAVAPALAGESLLPDLACGKVIATVAVPPHVPYAVDADIADVVLTPAGPAAVGARVTSVDAARRLFRVEAAAVEHPAFEVGVLAVSAQLVGLGQAMVERAVEYAKTRTQFGGPIGRFQAVKHLLADALVGVELARPLVYGAAVTMSPRDISAAKVAAGEAADRAARVALQVHGAVGYTQEYDLGLWLTKARALRSAWGTPSTHRTRVLDSLIASRSR